MFQFPKVNVFIGHESLFRRYYIQNVKDGIQIQVYNINNENVNHSSQFISVKVKKNVRKSQALFRENLRKLRLKQNESFLFKKKCSVIQSLHLYTGGALLCNAFWTQQDFHD